MSSTHETVFMCATMSQTAQEDPIGTAAVQQRYVMVEVASPWTPAITGSHHFPVELKTALPEMMQNKPFRLLAFTSDTGNSPRGLHRVFFYTKPSDAMATYDKQEYVVPEQELCGLINSVLAGKDLTSYVQYKHIHEGRDLFVCTHGSHDACCAKLGYPVYHKLQESYVPQSEGTLRVWRTSHIGGHRYAPTLLDMPEGRYWAHLDDAAIKELIERKGSVSSLYRYYRGWGALKPYEQVVEREIWIRHGWEWLDWFKHGDTQPQEDGTARVRINYRSPSDSRTGAYEAVVRQTGTIQLKGSCGDKELRDVAQYEVTDLIHLYPK